MRYTSLDVPVQISNPGTICHSHKTGNRYIPNKRTRGHAGRRRGPEAHRTRSPSVWRIDGGVKRCTSRGKTRCRPVDRGTDAPAGCPTRTGFRREMVHPIRGRRGSSVETCFSDIRSADRAVDFSQRLVFRSARFIQISGLTTFRDIG